MSLNQEGGGGKEEAGGGAGCEGGKLCCLQGGGGQAQPGQDGQGEKQHHQRQASASNTLIPYASLRTIFIAE